MFLQSDCVISTQNANVYHMVVPRFSCWVQWRLYPAKVDTGVVLSVEIDDLQFSSTFPGINYEVYTIVSTSDCDALGLVEVQGLYMKDQVSGSE